MERAHIHQEIKHVAIMLSWIGEKGISVAVAVHMTQMYAAAVPVKCMINTRTSVRCDGFVYYKGQNMECCGNNAYDRHFQLCCQGLTQSAGVNYACCGQYSYYVLTHTCSGNFIFPIPPVTQPATRDFIEVKPPESSKFILVTPPESKTFNPVMPPESKTFNPVTPPESNKFIPFTQPDGASCKCEAGSRNAQDHEMGQGNNSKITQRNSSRIKRDTICHCVVVVNEARSFHKNSVIYVMSILIPFLTIGW